MSAKRAAKRRPRSEVVELVHARDRVCVARELVPSVDCWGPLDVDEKVRRSRRKDAELDVENCQLLCRAHHDWKGLNRIAAAELGLCPFPYWYTPDE